jgi:hypothetical protein
MTLLSRRAPLPASLFAAVIAFGPTAALAQTASPAPDSAAPLRSPPPHRLRAPRLGAWGIARDARLVVEGDPGATGGPPPIGAHGPYTHVEFVSEALPQTVSLYLGQIERGTARFNTLESVYRDLCTTPCAREFAPGRYELRTSGSGVSPVVRRYEIPHHPVRFHLQMRPGWAAGVGGAAIAVGIVATLVSIGLIGNASIMNQDATAGFVVLGGGVAFGLLGAGLEIWAQSTGAARVESIPRTQ